MDSLDNWRSTHELARECVFAVLIDHVRVSSAQASEATDAGLEALAEALLAEGNAALVALELLRILAEVD